MKTEQEIVDFLESDAPVAVRLIKNPSSWDYRFFTLLGFKKKFFSLKEFLILLLPISFSLKRKYLHRQWEFLDAETKYEMRDYLNSDGSLNVLGNSFVGPNYAATLRFIHEVILSDQYHAKDFLKKDSVVIDAGANIGTFSVFAANLSPEGHVYAFEPVKSTFYYLENNAKKYPQIICVNKGLGSEGGDKDILNLGEGNGSNVLTDSPFYQNSEKKEGRIENVIITTIDDFVREHNIEKVDFIKIDTEGYEANILKGAVETIKKFKPTIAMSAYHNPGDKKELPNILRNIRSDYVCDLHSDCEEDFICYVPTET